MLLKLKHILKINEKFTLLEDDGGRKSEWDDDKVIHSNAYMCFFNHSVVLIA